ncbi:hypothetical protein LTS18_005742, partial [Coniosporium uncinatum]
QTLAVKPEVVEIVTWNDYGESHYIGPIYDAGVVNGTDANAHRYVDGMPHDGWRTLLPYYIAAYKHAIGVGPPPLVEEEKLEYWYRLTPKAAGSTNGVTGNNCNNPNQQCLSPNDVVQDKVFVTALVKSLPASISVQIGDNAAATYDAYAVGPNHFSQEFNGQTGPVTFGIVRGGETVLMGTGESILARPVDGITNYNAWVGGVSA